MCRAIICSNSCAAVSGHSTVMMTRGEKPARFWLATIRCRRSDRPAGAMTAGQALRRRKCPVLRVILGMALGCRLTRRPRAYAGSVGPAFAQQEFNLGPVEARRRSHTPNNARFDARYRRFTRASYERSCSISKLGSWMDWRRAYRGFSRTAGSPPLQRAVAAWGEDATSRCRSRGRRWRADASIRLIADSQGIA